MPRKMKRILAPVATELEHVCPDEMRIGTRPDRLAQETRERRVRKLLIVAPRDEVERRGRCDGLGATGVSGDLFRVVREGLIGNAHENGFNQIEKLVDHRVNALALLVGHLRAQHRAESALKRQIAILFLESPTA